jgi:tetratricopeptide (TPR) repeat protein
MTDPIAQLWQTIAEILLQTPAQTPEQLASVVCDAILAKTELATTLKTDSRMVQINQANATGYQVLVEGGIAYIGTHYQVDGSTLKPLLENVLRQILQKPVGIPQNLPRGGAPKFVGRDRELVTLHNQLQQDDRLAIASVQGMGGVGKTELALQYGLKHLQVGTYSGGVCWLRSREDAGIQILEFAQRQLSLQPPEELELVGRVEYCWRHWREGEVLTIFDDVQDYENIRLYLPPMESRFKVLLTTRLRLGSSMREVELQVLEKDAALELLRAIVGRDRIEAQVADADALCEWLGYLPLGLELVGRYLEKKSNISLQLLLERLKGQKLTAQALSRVAIGMTAQRGIAAAFELSWEELSTSAQELAGLLSLFASAPIPWNLVERFYPGEVLETLEDSRDEELLSLHLLQQKEENTYSIHPLIREFFSQKCTQQSAEYDKNSEKDILRVSYCLQMYILSLKIESGLPTKFSIEDIKNSIPHIAEITTHDNLNFWKNEECMSLIEPFVRIAQFWQGQAAYDEAMIWCRKGLSTVRAYLGDNHLDTAKALCHLGGISQIKGEYAESESFYIESLAIGDKSLEKDNFILWSNLSSLAELYRIQGRFSEAEKIFIESITIFESALDLDPLDNTSSINNLAELYRNQGRYGEAEPLYKKAIAILEKCLGKKHPRRAMVLNNLAELYRAQKKTSEAKFLYEEALKILEENLGNYHTSFACVSHNLGSLYLYQNDYCQAELLYVKSLEIDEKCYGFNHPEVATDLNNLSQLYKAQGRYIEAENALEKSIDIVRRKFGTIHPMMASGLYNLADLYIEQKQFEKSELLLIDALKIWEQLRSLNPERIRGQASLATLYICLDRHVDALPHISDIVEGNLIDILLDYEDIKLFFEITGILDNLIAFYFKKECYETTEFLLSGAIKIHRNCLNLDDSIQFRMPNYLGNLGGIYCMQNRLADAENLLLEALKIQELDFEFENDDIAKNFYNLGATYQLQMRLEKAELSFRKALKIWKKDLSLDHPHIISTLKLIDMVRRAQTLFCEDPKKIMQRKRAKRGFGKT